MSLYLPRPNNLGENIKKMKSVFFYAAPGTGKTVFIQNELIDSNILYIDLSNSFTLRDLAYSIIKQSDNFFNKETKINLKTNDINLFKIALLYPIYESEIRLFDLTICFDNFNNLQFFDTKDYEILKMLSEIILRSDINTIFVLNKILSKDIFNNPASYLYRFSDEINFDLINEDDIYITSKEYLNKFNIKIKKEEMNFVSKEFNFNPMNISIFLNEIILVNNKVLNNKLINTCIEKVYEIRKHSIQKELNFLVAKKNLSDILFYVAANKNVYKFALDINRMLKSNVKKALNELENLGLIVQENNYKRYICRDNLLRKYILDNFNKGIFYDR